MCPTVALRRDLVVTAGGGYKYEAETERFRVRDGHVEVHVLEAEEERGADGDAGGVEGRGEAAESVDVGCEGGVVACGEGVGGVGEEGGDHGGTVAVDGELQGSLGVHAIGCAQRQRVLADQELENGGIAVVDCSVVKGSVHTAAGDGQQARLPRVELGLHYHQLKEFQRRRAVIGPNDGSGASLALEEELVDGVLVC